MDEFSWRLTIGLRPADVLIWPLDWSGFGGIVKGYQLSRYGPLAPWRYGHVALVLDHGEMLETSRVDGLEINPLLSSDVLCCPKHDPLVIPRNDLTDEQREHIVERARTIEHAPYSYRAIAATIGIGTPGPGRVCSTLVAALYAEAGAPLLPKPWHRVTPVDLARHAMKGNHAEDV